MNREQQPGCPQPPTGANPGTEVQPVPGRGLMHAQVPALWWEFGQQVLAVHHRQGLGAQCVCGSLMYHCPVIAAAERLGLPIDDPAQTPRDSASRRIQ